MRLRLIAIASTLLFASAANAVPPGSDDEIAARIKPFGAVNRAAADVEPEGQTATAAKQVSFEKVSLSEGNEHVVEMLNTGPEGAMVFKPAVLKVSVGDVVHFKATDLAHNSVSMDGMIPQGAESWAGALSADISVTMDAEGIYVYQCDPHLIMAMVGVIQVGEAVNKEAIEASASAMKNGFAMNADRLENYLSQL